MRSLIAVGAAALLAGMAPALANNTPPMNIPSLADWEQNSVMNLTGLFGVPLSYGPTPAITGTCATATPAGGPALGTMLTTAGCSAQTIIFTFPIAAPNGYTCGVKDQTTTADTFQQTANTTTSCTVTGTAASGDRLIYDLKAF